MNPDASNELATLLREVRKLVADAGAAILEVYAGAHGVEYKSDDSPITRADRAAHEVLAAGLRRLTPGIPVLSEESADEHAVDVRRHWRSSSAAMANSP